MTYNRMYIDELAEFMNGMADQILLEKKDSDDPAMGVTEAFTFGYNAGLGQAAMILRKTAARVTDNVEVYSKIRNNDRQCHCEVTEHIPECPSWGV